MTLEDLPTWAYVRGDSSYLNPGSLQHPHWESRCHYSGNGWQTLWKVAWFQQKPVTVKRWLLLWLNPLLSPSEYGLYFGLMRPQGLHIQDSEANISCYWVKPSAALSWYLFVALQVLNFEWVAPVQKTQDSWSQYPLTLSQSQDMECPARGK
jgi:hypothetical protein